MKILIFSISYCCDEDCVMSSSHAGDLLYLSEIKTVIDSVEIACEFRSLISKNNLITKKFGKRIIDGARRCELSQVVDVVL